VAAEAGSVRVLIIHPRDLGAPTSGGIQTFLHDFVKFSPADFDITLAGVTRDQHARPIGSPTRVFIDGRAATMLPLGPAGPLPRSPTTWLRMALAQVRLRRRLLDRYTIIQVHRPFRGIVLAGQRGPRVQFVHLDLDAWPGPLGWPRLGRLYQSFSDPALDRMARVYVVSERGARVLRQAHPRLMERIEFLPVWHDPAVFRAPVRDEREAARAGLATRLGLAGGRDNVQLALLAGRLDSVKDPLLALDAIARLPATVHLLVAGEGELRSAVESRIADLRLGSRVHLLGDVARDELAELMRAADCLLLTSRSEGGGPRVVVEALASGLAVVATDVGEVRRTVSDGVNGRVVGAHAAGSLAEALEWTLAQPRDGLAAAAVAAAAPYTAESVLAPLYATYRRLVGEAR
jgi:glycosyltransferase involved in cell wall biosynthesis